MGAGTGISAPAQSSSATDYGTLSTPAVWRGTRTSAAQKVDALSSGGMDDYEIPAFLRKQAD
jgi:cell division protein FtsZ